MRKSYLLHHFISFVSVHILHLGESKIDTLDVTRLIHHQVFRFKVAILECKEV